MMLDREKIINSFENCCNAIPCNACGWNACKAMKIPPSRMHIPLDLCLSVLALMKEQPEIIRCKDCKHWNKDDHDCNIRAGWFSVSPDWFCADGEKGKE